MAGHQGRLSEVQAGMDTGRSSTSLWLCLPRDGEAFLSLRGSRPVPAVGCSSCEEPGALVLAEMLSSKTPLVSGAVGMGKQCRAKAMRVLLCRSRPGGEGRQTHRRDVPRLVLVVCVHCHPSPAENLFLMLQLLVVQLCIPDSPITLLMFLGIAVCIVNNIVLKVCVHVCQQTWRLMF